MHTTNMIEHPILFQTEMVKAIMAEQKTQTRRCNGLKTINENPSNWVFIGIENNHSPHDGYSPHDGGWGAVFENVYGDRTRVKVPYGIVGHCMWVRETFQMACSKAEESRYLFKADGGGSMLPWKPSIHMPRFVARNFLIVTSGRVERLNDITDEDCIAEGVRFDKDSGYYFAGDKIMTSSEKWAFVQLWESINGQNSWDKNPWVWVYDFKLITDWSNN